MRDDAPRTMTKTVREQPSTNDQPPLFYLVDWLPPEFGAVGQYALLFAAAQAGAGRSVHLIGLTSGAASVTNEAFAGGGQLTVTRIHAKAADKTSLAARVVWSALTNCRLVWTVLRAREARSSEILFTGSPPFILYFVVLAKYLKSARLTYRITDFYPEVVIAALERKSRVLELINKLTWILRRRVDRFEAIGEDQRQILMAGGIAADRIRVARDKSPVDFPGDQAPAPRPAELGGRLALLYSGNYGVAHDVDTVVEGLAHHQLRGSGRFALWINGPGANAERVAAGLLALGAPVARTPPAPLLELASILQSAHVHLITLRSGFAGLVLPSKVYGCLASGRPVLFVGPEASDVHLLCSQAVNAYRRVEPGDAVGFAAALEELADLCQAEQAGGC
jgi:glycosyltransferase involved in cell wall biosynthesis